MSSSFLRPVLAAAPFGALAAWPFIMSSPYDLRLLTLAGVFAILVIGYQYIFGYAGELSLAQGAFFGFSAYITGILAAKAGWSFPATFACSILGAIVLACIVSIPVLRLASHYFALATLGVGQVLQLLARDWQSLTGGAIGLSGVPLPEIMDMQIARGWPLLLFVWTFVAVAAAIAFQTKRGLYGLACHVVRSNPMAARSLAINPDALRAGMFLMSAGMAGAAGALHAHTIRIVSPEALEFKVMISCMTMAVIGGRTQIWGAIAGALLIVHLPEWLRGFEQSYILITSMILLLILIAAPEGVAGLIERLLPETDKSREPGTPATREGLGAPPPGQVLMPSETPILSIHDVNKSFGGVHALGGVSFSLMRGSITAVIGPNGSGKTTLVNCITGVYGVDSGRIALGGASLAGRPSHEIAALGIARTFQNLQLVEDMTVIDNLATARFRAERISLRKSLPTGWHDPSLMRARAYAMAMLRRFGIAQAAFAKCGSLPHGTKRLVEIARAVCLEPSVLLLDEPAAGLNETEQSALAGHLQMLATQGLTLLIVEHNMAFLKTVATHMVCLDYGQVIASGRPQAIYADKRVIEAYIGTDHLAEQSL